MMGKIICILSLMRIQTILAAALVVKKWNEKEVALYGKPAIFGRLPHGKTNPKVQFPVQKVQNKC